MLRIAIDKKTGEKRKENTPNNRKNTNRFVVEKDPTLGFSEMVKQGKPGSTVAAASASVKRPKKRVTYELDEMPS
jgi:hypothetical protein